MNTLRSEWNIGCSNLLSRQQYAFFDYINNFLPPGETDWALHFIVIILQLKSSTYTGITFYQTDLLQTLYVDAVRSMAFSQSVAVLF